MQIKDCFGNPDLVALTCRTAHSGTTDCFCALRPNTLKNIQTDYTVNVYNDLKINDTLDGNKIESWNPNTKMRVLDCLEMDQNAEWQCITYTDLKNQTYCQCSLNDFLNYIEILNTKNLYKDLGNIAFKSHKDSMSESSLIQYVPDFGIRFNSNNEEIKSYIHLYIMFTIAFTIVFYFLLLKSFRFIYRSFKPGSIKRKIKLSSIRSSYEKMNYI